MKWQGRRGSSNIVDRRGQRGGGGLGPMIGGGGRGGRGVAVGGGGIGLLAILLIGWFLGIDLTGLAGGGQGAGPAITQPSGELSAAEQRAGEFVSVVLADTEEVWAELFPIHFGQPYREPQLVLFSGATQSACGGASAATGPFYCPPEQTAFLDTQFFAVMEQQLGAGGDFAAAYVIAHEIAHHVQNELGILEQVNAVRSQVSEVESNAFSVRTELQADCLAGVWANHADRKFDILENGDIAEAVNAAEQIGDDTLQANAGQRVQPHTFTHGTSEQRARWFTTGFETGDPTQCNTFALDDAEL